MEKSIKDLTYNHLSFVEWKTVSQILEDIGDEWRPLKPRGIIHRFTAWISPGWDEFFWDLKEPLSDVHSALDELRGDGLARRRWADRTVRSYVSLRRLRIFEWQKTPGGTRTPRDPVDESTKKLVPQTAT